MTDGLLKRRTPAAQIRYLTEKLMLETQKRIDTERERDLLEAQIAIARNCFDGMKQMESFNNGSTKADAYIALQDWLRTGGARTERRVLSMRYDMEFAGGSQWEVDLLEKVKAGDATVTTYLAVNYIGRAFSLPQAIHRALNAANTLRPGVE